MKKRWFGTKVKSYSSKITLEQLEERIVLDASVPAASVDNPDNPENTQVEQQAEQAHTPDAQNAPTQAAADAATSADPLGDLYTGDSAQVLMSSDLANVESVSTEALRAVVVSSDIRDGADLVAAVQDNVITITYDAANSNTESILSAIESALDGKVVDSLGFITHDDGAGAFSLTQDISVSFNTLTSDASLQDFWSAVGAFVQPDGRIDIMACDVAATDAGLDLVAQLETLTGRNVAASADDTGNDLFGGNWELETDNVSLVPAYFDPYAVQFFDGVLADPTATNTTNTVTYNESAATVELPDIVVTDGDLNDTITATLTLDDYANAGTLSSTAGTFTNGVWTVSGTVGDVNTALAALVYNHTENYDQDTHIDVAIMDSTGTEADVTGTITLDVNPENDAPTGTNLSTTATYTEGAASVAIDNIVITDVDTGANITATLTLADYANAGTLSSTVGTFTNGVWTVSGTVGDVNTALANLVFNPNTNYDLDTTIDVSITDGVATPITGTITLDVTAVNDAPVAAASAVTASEDTVFSTFTASSFTFSDVENNSLASIKITSLPNVQHGTLKLSSGGTESNVDVNQIISATDIPNLKFYPTLNNTTAASFNFMVNDGADWSANAATMTVNVTPISDGNATISVPSSGLYYTANTTIPVGLGGIGVGNVGSDPVKVTLSVQDPSVYNVVGMLTNGTQTGESLTYQGTDVSGWLDAISFIPKAGYGQDVKVDLVIEDGDANVTQTFTIYANHAPVFQDPTDDFSPTTPVTVEYDLKQYSVYLPDLRVDEYDTGDTLSVKITLADKDTGYLTTLNNMYGGDYNDATGVWTLNNASVASVNSALRNMVFMPDDDNHVNTSVTVKVWDAHMTEAQAIEQVVNLNVGAFVDFPASVINFHNTTTNINIDTITVFDPGAPVTVTLKLSDATAGTLLMTPYPSGTDYTVVKTGTDTWKIEGALAKINTVLGNLAYDPLKEQSNTLSVKVSYNGTETHEDAIQLAFVADTPGVNDQLEASFYINGQTVALTTTPSVDYQEGHTNIYLPAVVVSDPDANEKVSATFTLTNTDGITNDQIQYVIGALQTYGTAKPLAHTNGTAIWTLSDVTVAEMNDALGHLMFMPAGDNDHDARLVVSIQDGNENGATAVVANIDLNVTPINDQPVFSDMPDSVITFDEGDAAGFVVATQITQTNLVTGVTTTIDHPIQVSDPDTGEDVTVTVTLSDAAAGTLSATGGGSFAAGAWTMTGQVGVVNNVLKTLTFDPGTTPQSVTLTVEVEDGGENGRGTTTEYIQLQFNADNDGVNDPLTGSFFINGQTVALTETPSVDYQEGFSNIYLPAIVVSDDDAGQKLSAEFVLSTADSLTAAQIESLVGAVETYGVAKPLTHVNNTAVWKLENVTVDQMNFALSHLKFMPVTDNDHDATLRVRIVEGTTYVENTTADVEANITLNVVPTNDQPVFSQFPASVIGLNDGVSSLAIVTSGNYIQVSDADTGEQVIVTLSLSDKTAGSLAVTPDTNGATDGAYSVAGNSSGVVTITGDQLGVNNALKTLVYNNTGDVSNGIRVEVKDGGEDYTGIRSGYIELQFNADDPNANDPLGFSFTSSSVEYDEDYANVYLPALVVSNDDVGQTLNATFTLSNDSVGSIQTYFGAKPLTGGTGGVWALNSVTLDQLNFALSHLKFMPAADNDVDANLTIRIDDGLGGGENVSWKTATITLNVNPINDQPVFNDLPATTITYNEGTTSVPIVASGATHKFDISDADTGETITATIRLSNQSTGTVKIGNLESEKGELTVEGTVAQIENMLNNQLAFAPLANNETNTYITVSIQDGGENGTIIMTERFALVVTPSVNDDFEITAPNLDNPDTVNMNAAAIALPDLVLSDISDDAEVTVTMSVDIGRQFASIQRDGVMDGLYDPATGKWEITGSLTQVNQALADVMFVPDNGFSVPGGAIDAGGGTTVSVQIKQGTQVQDGKIWIVNNTSFFEML